MGDPDREVPQDPWEPVPWRITILAEVNEPEAGAWGERMKGGRGWWEVIRESSEAWLLN